MRVIGLIPARGGSKGISRKNLRKLGGLSLVTRAVLVAAEVLPRADIFVSTEDPEIAACSGPAQVLKRPAELAQDDTPMVDVVRHAIKALDVAPMGIFVLLQPSSPFRTSGRIREALEVLRWGWTDSVVSVRAIPAQFHPSYSWSIVGGGPNRQMRAQEFPLPACRQSLEPRYVCDGSFYVFYAMNVKRWGNIFGETVAPVVIPDDESLNLNDASDWQEAERRVAEMAIA